MMPTVQPQPTLTRLQTVFLFLAGAAIFFLLRPFQLEGGDTKIFLSPLWSFMYGRQLVWYTREPLAHTIIQVIDIFTHDRRLAFQISGAVCGGLYLVVLSRFSLNPLFWLITLLSSATWVFVGHFEYYAPIAVALAFYYLMLVRALEREPRATPAAVGWAFSLAFLMHKGSLFFLPAMFWLMFTREGGRWARRPWPGRRLEWGIAAATAGFFIDMIPALLAQMNIGMLYITVNEKIYELITPPTQAIADWIVAHNTTGLWWVYLLGRPLHWAYFFGFLAAGAPLGLPVLAWQLLKRRKHWIGSDGAKALLTASAIAVVWIFFWHPRALWMDWDLFAMGTLPVNLLAGGIVAGIFDQDE